MKKVLLGVFLLVLVGVAEAQNGPPPPDGLASKCTPESDGGASVILSWNPASQAASYHLRLNDPTNDDPASCGWNCGAGDFEVNYLAATSYSFAVAPGRAYSWWVHSVDGSNAWGPAAGGSFTCDAPPPPPVEPSVDVNLTFTLSWIDNSPDNPPEESEDEFWIYRNIGSDPPRVGVVGKNVTTFTDTVTKIYPGQGEVCYQVLASNANGQSPKSEAACGPTGIQSPDTPAAPSNLTVQ